MYTVDLYLRVRLACHVDGLSQREAASRFGIARETVRKMPRHSEPPGYRRRQPPKRPKLAPFTDIIDRILEEDRPVHRKQHHTAKRIFERLRDEHGFTGKETIVKDYVRERRLRRREMFVPLSHPPGHAQADFGEADAIIAGVKYRAHFFVMTLPHSDACFVAAYPAATTEACNRANVVHKPRLLSDNGSSYISGALAEWLEDHGMDHVRGAPYHPQTQGKIERWHQTLKNRILLDNYHLPGDLENQISAFVDHYNNQRYHESIGNVTPADACFGRHTAIIKKSKKIKKLTTQNRRLNHQRQAA